MSFMAYQIKKLSGAKDHGKNYIKVRPPLVRHLLRNRLVTFLEKVVGIAYSLSKGEIMQTNKTS